MSKEYVRNLKIGTVESVSPSEIRVLLELDAPQSTALNVGFPSSFPKINSFVLIPNEMGAIIGVIGWIGVERSPFPKRIGSKDFGLVDLPYPLRKMSLTPIGTLRLQVDSEGKEYFKLERGVSSFPSVGDSVIIPSQDQLESIVEKNDKDAKLKIGTAPLAGSARVFVDPNKLFARHLAILGNTGSGKSCSVAGLIRWSLKAARENLVSGRSFINARFIILDPNGEYTKVFSDCAKVRLYKLSLGGVANTDGAKTLILPAWFWNSSEWINFVQAAPGAQRPMLMDALKILRLGGASEKSIITKLRSYMNGILQSFKAWASQESLRKKEKTPIGYKLELISKDMNEKYLIHQNIEQSVKDKIASLISKAQELKDAHFCSFQERDTGKTINYYNEISETELDDFIVKIEDVIDSLPESTTFEESNITADTPVYFNVKDLPDYLETMATDQMGRDISQFISILNMRIRTMLTDSRLRPILCPEEQLSLVDLLKNYIGDNAASNGEIAIFDLSLVPSDVQHLIIAVLSRIIFEAQQRYKRHHEEVLPTVLVLEEAHTFLRAASEGDRRGRLCCEVFERIAREGRKFGLSMVLSSQRPSEISPTVLSQCNTFLLHRIVNDRDQELVRRLVPDTIGSLLKELPTLPTQQAILLGWAAPIPVLVEIDKVPEKYQPQSSDPKYWEVWTGLKELSINWDPIVNEWQGRQVNNGQANETEGSSFE